MRLKLVPTKTDWKFLRLRMGALVFSAFAMLASIVAVATLGLNFGIDFRGGVTVEFSGDSEIDVEAARGAVSALDLGDVSVNRFSFVNLEGESETGVAVYVEQQRAEVEETTPAAPLETAEEDTTEAAATVSADDAGADAPNLERAQQTAAALVQDALRETFGEDIVFRRVDVVGPVVSGELIQAGALAILFAIAGMLLYIWLRFEWQFSLGAIVALVHDVVLTLGVFAVTRLEFNLSIIAAILTIVGYSMNDTVVVYDRVRENLRKYKKMPLPALLDLSINDTLSRTVMTSVTTLLALGSLFFLGGEVLRGFSFAMIWGVVVGTYSSVFIASPFLMLTGVKRDWGASGAPATA